MTRTVLLAGALALGSALGACGIPDRSPPAASDEAPDTGLATACAAQWAASIVTYAGSDAPEGPDRLVLPVVLLAPDGTAPRVKPTGARLITDRGPLDLAVGEVTIDPDDHVPGAARVELFLPALDPGSWSAQFLELDDERGTWRFRVGDYAITALSEPAPDDIEKTGGTRQTGMFGVGAGFELRVRNPTLEPLDVTGVETDIPGVPVTWGLVALDPVRFVDTVAVPPDGGATLAIGTDGATVPVAFVLASPQVVYRVGDNPERRAWFEPVVFELGLGMPSTVAAYRAALPPDACAALQP